MVYVTKQCPVCGKVFVVIREVGILANSDETRNPLSEP
jgi:hypothetical protein